jgi:hypothetical protein
VQECSTAFDDREFHESIGNGASTQIGDGDDGGRADLGIRGSCEYSVRGEAQRKPDWSARISATQDQDRQEHARSLLAVTPLKEKSTEWRRAVALYVPSSVTVQTVPSSLGDGAIL